MASTPDNPTPPNKKDFDDAYASLRLTEQSLANVEQKFQRLLLLQKSIELKIVDPKDIRNFEKFLKELSKVDVTNLTELKKIGGYVGAGSAQMSTLANYSADLNKQSETYVKHLIDQKEEYGQIIRNTERYIQTQKQSNQQSKKAVSSIEEFNDVFADSLSNYDLTVDIQGKVLKGLESIRSGQVKNMGLADAFASSYADLASNLGNSIAGMGTFRPEISPVVEFEFLEGYHEYIQEQMDSILKSVGSPTFEIDGISIPSDLRNEVFENLSELYNEGTSKFSDVIKSTVNELSLDISRSFGTAADVASGLIEDLINDQARLSEGLTSILSPQRQKDVQDFYKQIQQSGDAAQKGLLAYTISAKMATSVMAADVDIMSKKLESVPRLDSLFTNLNSSTADVINQLQHITESLMPRWLTSALGVNDAFDSIKTQASKSVQNLVVDLSSGGDKLAAISKFTQSFSSGLIGALGPLALIVISVTSLWNLLTSAGESTKELSTEFGVSRAVATDMHKSILGMTSAIGNASLKQEHILDVLKKHRDEYGLIMDLNNKANQEAVKFSAELGKQYGIGASEAYGFTQQLQQLGADASASQEMAAVVAHASNLAGIPFNAITKDLSESSEFVATQFAGMPQQAVATAAKLRAMGTSLKAVEKTIDKVFDTKNFLQGMTELNIMTRGVVDLTAMFSKTLKGDVEGAATEVAKQFDKMVASGQTNMYQMRQFAQVTGQSVEELMRGNKIRQQQVELGEDNVALLSKYLDKLSDADVADAKSAMTAAKRLGAAEKLDEVWSSIKDTLMEALMPALEGMSDLIVAIAPVLKIVGILFKGIGIVIKGLSAPLAVVYDIISGIGDMWNRVAPKFERTTGLFGEWGSVLSVVKNIASILVGLWAGNKMLGGVQSVFNMFKGIRGEQGNILKDSMTLVGRFKEMFTGSKGGIGGLLGKSQAGMSPVPNNKSGGKSIFSTGFDKVKALIGMKPAADPLAAAGAELKESANELKTAAQSLSTGGSDMYSGNSRGRRRGTPGRPGRRNMSRRALPRTRLRGLRIPTPAAGLTSSTTGNALSGAGNMMKGVGNMLKGFNPMKLIKGLGPGLITTAIGMGTDVLADKYEAKALESGDKGDLNKARAAKVGSSALEGAGYGAMIGSIVPVIGTAVGGAIGGVLGGAFGVWDNFFSDDAKRQTEQLQQMKSSNKILNGLADLTESEMQQLKQAGYSDELVKKISAGNISLEGAIKEQYAELNLNEDQLKKLTNPNTSGKDRDIIMQSAAGIPTPSLKVGTNLVKSDGLAMLHRNEAVVPAEVVKGGFMSQSQRVEPVTNEMTDLSAIKSANSVQVSDYNESSIQSKTKGNQDALLKQFMSIMQDVANRPVQVQIAGVELKALNNKMKVLNNKA